MMFIVNDGISIFKLRYDFDRCTYEFMDIFSKIIEIGSTVDN